MAFYSHSLLITLLTLVLPFPAATASRAQLTENYYDKTCPKFNEIVNRIVTEKQIATPTTAAAVLRLFFHDCVLEGCDASLLIASNSFNKAERDADINVAIPGDGFDVVTRIKTALELQCPGVVSCADILSAAARNLVNMVGGPHYTLRFGRKDGLISRADRVEGHYARTNMTISEIINLFSSINLSVQDLVALSGAHTIGFSHCNEFAKRLFNFSTTAETDPALNRNYAEGLRKLCANYTTNPGMSAFNDVMTPGKFDNLYFQNLQRGLGLLATDNALVTDPRTKPFVDLYAADQAKFFEDFGQAIQRVSLMKVKTGKHGEVRRRCDAFNNLQQPQDSNNKSQDSNSKPQDLNKKKKNSSA
ncbi:unnamed protein product [Malus baccata var. baccata]